MRAAEYMDLLNRLEQRHPAADWSAENIHLWPLIRISLASQLVYAGETTARRSDRHPVLERLRDRWAHATARLKDHFANAVEGAADILFLAYTMDRTKVGDSYENRLVDPLVSAFAAR